MILYQPISQTAIPRTKEKMGPSYSILHVKGSPLLPFCSNYFSLTQGFLVDFEGFQRFIMGLLETFLDQVFPIRFMAIL